MKILVGISGGVDSAAAAKILISEGHAVEGAVLIMHEHTELEAAREVASEVGIYLHEIDCRASFESIVKADFVKEYLRGRTPNPCIICNQRVKFENLYRYARENGFDAIATGHYARVVKVGEGDARRLAVSMAGDGKKDQSYMLYRLPQHVLSSLVLPLSELDKARVRAMADSAGISAAERSDSQEICFLPDGDHAEYIESVAGKCPEGDFISPDGSVLGRHKGIIRYTVGQRKGLGIALGERVFVTDINAERNTVTLSPDMVGRTHIELSDVVFSGMKMPDEPTCITVDVRIRYTAPLAEAEALISPDGRVALSFGSPGKAAPGQSAVAYENGVVLFGGYIG